jgi:hypothetical protein
MAELNHFSIAAAVTSVLIVVFDAAFRHEVAQPP